ncbi:MAG: flagellar hook assembly protein FlgD [Acidobacteriota bacterium]
MDIPGLTDSTAAGLIPGAPVAPPTVGREEFLRLLVTKLANQNPLQPTDDTQFISQLAQFSELEQSIQTNTNLMSLAQGQSSLVNSQALLLVGREVLINSGDKFQIRNGQPDKLVLDLDEEISGGKLEVFDSTGKLVETIELDAAPAGRRAIPFDGQTQMDAEGNIIDRPLTDGDYTFKLTTFNGTGSVEAGQVLISRIIEGINFTEGVPVLVANGQNLPFSDIVEIRDSAGA